MPKQREFFNFGGSFHYLIWTLFLNLLIFHRIIKRFVGIIKMYHFNYSKLLSRLEFIRLSTFLWRLNCASLKTSFEIIGAWWSVQSFIFAVSLLAFVFVWSPVTVLNSNTSPVYFSFCRMVSMVRFDHFPFPVGDEIPNSLSLFDIVIKGK